MKKTFLTLAVTGFFLGSMFVSCQKEVEDTVTRDTTEALSAEQLNQILEYMATQEAERMAAYKQGNGNGAVFIVPASNGLNWGLNKDVVFNPTPPPFLPISGESASFGADYGDNDFWRQNPDGTVSVHLVSSEANASYTNWDTGESYEGTGHASFNYTGRLDTFNVPFPPFQLIFLGPDPSENALTVTGNARVTLNGDPGPSRKLHMRIINTPGGNNNSDLSLK